MIEMYFDTFLSENAMRKTYTVIGQIMMIKVNS